MENFRQKVPFRRRRRVIRGKHQLHLKHAIFKRRVLWTSNFRVHVLYVRFCQFYLLFFCMSVQEEREREIRYFVSFERENTKLSVKRGKETEIPSSLTAPDVNDDETINTIREQE